MFSFSKKTQSIIIFISRKINSNFKEANTDFIPIDGPIAGKLYLKKPVEKLVIFTIEKHELQPRVNKEILDKLPEMMYFV